MNEIERHWLSRPGFTRHFAIRMPDGSLYRHQPEQQPNSTQEYAVHYYGIPSYMRDMYGMTEPQQASPPVLVVFDSREGAEKLLHQLREQAARVGVVNWGGCVVERLCTPFSSGDAAIEFAGEVQRWLAEHGGEA